MSKRRGICGQRQADGSRCTNAAGCAVPHPSPNDASASVAAVAAIAQSAAAETEAQHSRMDPHFDYHGTVCALAGLGVQPTVDYWVRAWAAPEIEIYRAAAYSGVSEARESLRAMFDSWTVKLMEHMAFDRARTTGADINDTAAMRNDLRDAFNGKNPDDELTKLMATELDMNAYPDGTN